MTAKGTDNLRAFRSYSLAAQHVEKRPIPQQFAQKAARRPATGFNLLYQPLFLRAGEIFDNLHGHHSSVK